MLARLEAGVSVLVVLRNGELARKEPRIPQTDASE
jgi:hypothetical protein